MKTVPFTKKQGEVLCSLYPFSCRHSLSHKNGIVSNENRTISPEKRSFIIKRKPVLLRELLLFKKPEVEKVRAPRMSGFTFNLHLSTFYLFAYPYCTNDHTNQPIQMPVQKNRVCSLILILYLILARHANCFSFIP
jgi:hypothetical protein